MLVADDLFDFVFDWSEDTGGKNEHNEKPDSESVSTSSSQYIDHNKIRKSISNKNGSKLPEAKRFIKSKSTHRIKSLSNESEPMETHVVRKKPLYVFPNFDKCDSLIYFPTSLTRHLNSDDMKAATKLISTHLSKDCNIRIDICPDQRLSVLAMLKLTRMLNAMQPDRVMCVHATKVDGNQIRSSVYFKSTECHAIIDGVARTTTDPLFNAVFPTSRNERLKQRIREKRGSTEEEERACALIDSDVDLLCYVHLHFVLTFDDLSRKITTMDISGTLTSVHEANVQ